MSDEIKRVGLIGAGAMGRPMAENLVKKGFETYVLAHRNRQTVEELVGMGAKEVVSAAEMAGLVQVIVTMVPDAPQVEEVLFGESGAAGALSEDALVIDMSTVSPTASRAIAERVAPRDFVEAPVSGSKPKAEDGTLTIFGGGEPPAFERALPVFEVLGERIVHVGPLGHGQMAKLLTNTMGAVHAAVLAEAVRTAKAAGLDEDAFLEVAAGSAGASAMLNLKGRPMFEETYEPVLFKLEHMLKDLRHTLDEARALGIELKLPSLAEGFYQHAVEAGHGEEDFAAVYAGVDGLPSAR